MYFMNVLLFTGVFGMAKFGVCFSRQDLLVLHVIKYYAVNI